ncbi:MAG: MSCRAMM family adhesin SdrC [Candidatus Obscuribacterales bacterium]|nr:MSCRAMM family adhesin SdrC [Candidatus Obscuribacterales bacterium]
MKSFPTKKNSKFSPLAVLICLAFLSSFSGPAQAESESGGFVFGGGESESGGPSNSGAESDSGGVIWGDANSESGGPADSGAESDSGGIAQSGAESESGGPTDTGADSEAGSIISSHRIGQYVQYYGP